MSFTDLLALVGLLAIIVSTVLLAGPSSAGIPIGIALIGLALLRTNRTR